MKRFRLVLASILCAVSTPHAAPAADLVGGTLITLTSSSTAPNGAYSWFMDERAIIDDTDPANTKLLVSSVSYASGGAERGDVDLLWLNIDTGAKGEFELSDRFESSVESPDDHNSASLLLRPDGHYLAMYATHGKTPKSYYRISTSAHDPTSWEPEIEINNGANTTYSNVHHLPNDDGGAGRTYNFTRSINFNPSIMFSDDLGESWTSDGAKLLTIGSGGVRPYVRYFSDQNRIHFTTTEGHPRNENNSIYHGYVEDGRLYNSEGAVIDSNLFDGNGVSPTALTTVFAANTLVGGVPMTRAWTVDTAINSAGNPVTVFQTRIDPGPLSDGQDSLDHQFFYASYDSQGWSVHPLAAAGRDIYAVSPDGLEDDYTGLVSIDPDDTSTVFMSSDIDPRTGVEMEHYEIFRGKTDDGGETWAWKPITFASKMDNVRPLVPKWSDSETALVWMRGDYNNFQNYQTEVVALADIAPLDILVGADFNEDGKTDVVDYAFLLRQLNQTFTGVSPLESALLGDLTGDLKTDFADLVAFRVFYDAANGAGQFAALTVEVPEPGSLTLLAIGISMVAARSVPERALRHP